MAYETLCENSRTSSLQVDTAHEPPHAPDGPARPWYVPPSRRWTVAIVLGLVYLAGIAGFVLGNRPEADLSRRDIGFLQDMAIHHEQAMAMASIANANAAEPLVRHFAREVTADQNYELGVMDQILAEQGPGRGSPNRRAMTWMGMSTTLGDMPGMATEAELGSLQTATGREVDRLFLTLMREHHLGGVHMAAFAASEGDDGRVRELAAQMARNQRLEVAEYDDARRRLGLAPAG